MQWPPQQRYRSWSDYVGLLKPAGDLIEQITPAERDKVLRERKFGAQLRRRW